MAVLTKCVFARVPWVRVSMLLLLWVETLQRLVGEENQGRRRSPWHIEACIHFLAGVPAVISAAVAAGDVDDDKMVAACRVMEEWMCDDAACVALVWLFALPSAGVTFSRMHI